MNWLQRFMYGRYGGDALSIALIVLGGVLSILGSLFGLWWLSLIGYIPVLLCIFRMFSRNIDRRRQENYRFLAVWSPIQTRLQQAGAHQKQKQFYRFFSCPQCKQKLRLPKGKGKITITCPKCHTQFTKKT